MAYGLQKTWLDKFQKSPAWKDPCFWSWKMSLLVIWKILGLFINTLTADGKYSLFNRDNI